MYEPIRRCTDDRNILDSLCLGAYRVLFGWVVMSDAKWQEVYTVQTAAITELEQRIAELQAERDAAFNKGMERAAEIIENTRSATGNERNLTQVELCAEAIRKEIDNE